MSILRTLANALEAARQRAARRQPRDEGMTVIYVSISMMMIMGAGAVAVDGGMMWKERRDLVADVDSASLAGAEVGGEENCNTGTSAWTTLASTHPVYDTAMDLLEDNQGATPNPADFTVELMCLDTESGKVRVTFNGQLDPFFSSVYGFADLTVQNQATVQFEPYKNGMRPLSICVTDGSSSTQIVNEQWLASPPGTKLTTSMNKTWKESDFDGLANGCGAGSSGSWGWICYDAAAADNPCNATYTAEMMLNGWPFDIDLGAPPPSMPPPPPYNNMEANDWPYNGWSDYDCQIRSSSSAGGDNDACDTRTSDQSSSNIQDAFDDLNCDLDAAGNLLASPPAAEDCAYKFPIMGIWELAGTGSNGILKPSSFVVVVMRYPSYMTKPKGSDPGGKDACLDVSNHEGPNWLNDPATWDDSHETCVTLELVEVISDGSLTSHDFIGVDKRLCGVAGDGGDRCDY